MSIKDLVRPNIVEMTPYSSARNEFDGEAHVFVDANEYPEPLLEPTLEEVATTGATTSEIAMPEIATSAESVMPEFATSESTPPMTLQNLNRYPDPLQRTVKQQLVGLRGFAGLDWSQIFLGNGSDEAIDVIYRTFCKPGADRVVIMPPTYGVYKVFANLNDVECTEVSLLPDFTLDIEALRAVVEQSAESVESATSATSAKPQPAQLGGSQLSSLQPKILWICSPNNPTGGLIPYNQIVEVLSFFPGIVVVDEAYIDFASSTCPANTVADPANASGSLANATNPADNQPATALPLLAKHENLIILRTLSKAWGLAGARIGVAIASAEIIAYFNKVKYPYNMGTHTQYLLQQAIAKEAEVTKRIAYIKEARQALIQELNKLPVVTEVIPSHANFILVRMKNGKATYDSLLDKGIVVRYRGNQKHCENTIRITIGTEQENAAVLEGLRAYNNTVCNGDLHHGAGKLSPR